MKFSIERGALLKAVAQAQSVVERRNTIPILANVLIEAEGDRVQFRATDLDIEIVDKAPAQVERAGAATVSAVLLHESPAPSMAATLAQPEVFSHFPHAHGDAYGDAYSGARAGVRTRFTNVLARARGNRPRALCGGDTTREAHNLEPSSRNVT